MKYLNWRGLLGMHFWVVVAASAFYVFVFYLLYPSRGASMAAFSVLPVILAGWWFGLRSALLSGFLFLVLNTLLLSWVDETTWGVALQRGGPGSLALFVAGGVVGRFHDLDRLLKRELTERKRAEESLRQHRDHLEDLVAERTLELQTTNNQLQKEISERQQIEDNLQKALEQANALNELKARFSSMVSHEFRTPLAVIQSSCDLLRLQVNGSTIETALKRLDKIETQVKHLVSLLDDILTISRAETVGVEFDPQPTDLRRYCHEMVKEVQQTTSNHHVAFSTDEYEILALIDSNLLRQAITNLLSNAFKYSPERTIVHVRLHVEGEHALISVQDEGIGIPEEDQQELFEVFHRAKNVGTIQGTGLGLTIVKQAVEAHGGTITVKSTLDVGTTFTIALPLMTVRM